MANRMEDAPSDCRALAPATHLKVRTCGTRTDDPTIVGMSAVIEVRTYRAKPGMREPLLELLRTRAFPVQRELGMKILGPFPNQADDVGFVWLRGFPDEASREPLKASFYEGGDWLAGLEAAAMPMLAHYSAVVVEDAADLWLRWPTEASPPVAGG